MALLFLIPLQIGTRGVTYVAHGAAALLLIQKVLSLIHGRAINASSQLHL